MRWKLPLVIATVCAMSGASALAATAAGTISARQVNYKQIGKAFKAIQDETRKSAPSFALIRANARTIHGLAQRIPRWFPRGSGPETGVRTRALPIIWQQPAQFRQSAANLVRAARALDAAAARGDAGATQAAATGLGEACKACHLTYRTRE